MILSFIDASPNPRILGVLSDFHSTLISVQSEVCPQLQDASAKSETTFITKTIIQTSDMCLQWEVRQLERDFSLKVELKMLEEPLCDDEYEYYTDEDEEADIEDEAGNLLLDNDC